MSSPMKLEPLVHISLRLPLEADPIFPYTPPRELPTGSTITSLKKNLPTKQMLADARKNESFLSQASKVFYYGQATAVAPLYLLQKLLNALFPLFDFSNGQKEIVRTPFQKLVQNGLTCILAVPAIVLSIALIPISLGSIAISKTLSYLDNLIGTNPVQLDKALVQVEKLLNRVRAGEPLVFDSYKKALSPELLEELKCRIWLATSSLKSEECYPSDPDFGGNYLKHSPTGPLVQEALSSMSRTLYAIKPSLQL